MESKREKLEALQFQEDGLGEQTTYVLHGVKFDTQKNLSSVSVRRSSWIGRQLGRVTNYALFHLIKRTQARVLRGMYQGCVVH